MGSRSRKAPVTRGRTKHASIRRRRRRKNERRRLIRSTGSSGVRRRRLAIRLAPFAILAAQNLIVFFRHYFAGYGFPWDFVGSYYASTAFWTQAAQHGFIPQWVPYQWMGYPLFMNPQTGLFYPPLWIFPLLRIPYTLHAAVILQCLHVLAGAVGMYAFLRVLLRSRRLAVVGAVAYQFFGGFFSNAEHVDIIRAYAFTPWLLAVLTFRGSDRTIPTRLLLLPMALLLMATGGYPGNVVGALILCGLYFVIQAVTQRAAGISMRTVAIRLAVGSVLFTSGIGMSAPDLAPPVLFRHELARYHSGPAQYATFQWIHLSGLFLPNEPLPGDISMTSTFVGFVILVGCVLLPRRSLRLAAAPAGTALFAAAMAAGPASPVYRLVRGAFPFAGSSRFPTSDYRAWFAIGLIVCATIALRALRRHPMPFGPALLRLAVFVVLVLWGVRAAYAGHPAPSAVAGPMVALAAAAAAIHAWQGPWRRRWLLATAALLTVMAADAGRVLRAVQTTWAVPDLLGYCSKYYPVPLRYQQTGEVIGPSVLTGTTRRPPRIDAGLNNYRSSGYLAGSYNTRDFGNLLFESKRRIEESEALRNYMRLAWTPVLVDDGAARRTPQGWNVPIRPEVSSPAGNVEQSWYGLDRISYAVSLSRPVLMVENESFFPGWTARLALPGREISVPAEKVDGALRGWRLPAGRYSMTAQFRFPGFPLMLAAAVASALLWVAGCALVRVAPPWNARRKARPRAPAPQDDSKRTGFVDARFAGMASLPGHCNVCGRKTRFYYRDPAAYRAELVCRQCLATSRYRSIARGILRAVTEQTRVRASSLAGLSRAAAPRRIAVYDTQIAFRYEEGPCAYPIPDLLAGAGWIDVESSLYRPGERWGKRVAPGVTNQNIEGLTFTDASFDIVITSDVMEHVRRADLAHREIRRVLKPGGIYVFTVPHFRDRPTLERVRLADPEDPSRDEYPFERVYHEDAHSDNRALVYREWGIDLDEALRALGFEVEFEMTDRPELGILNTELFYCRLPDVGPASRRNRNESRAGLPRIASETLMARVGEARAVMRPRG